MDNGRRHKSILFLMLFISVIWFASLTACDVLQSPTDIVKQFEDSLSKGDTATAERYLTPDLKGKAIFSGGVGVLRTGSTGPSGSPPNYLCTREGNIEIKEERIQGNTAYVSATDGCVLASWKGKTDVLYVLYRLDGVWKINDIR